MDDEDFDDFNDSDSLLGNERQGEEVKPWDRFQIIHRKPAKGSTQESKFIDNGTVLLKVFTIFIVFFVVLASAVISKGLFLFMTSQVKLNVTRPYCNKDLDRSRQYVFSMPTVERTTWIWLIMFAYFVPEVATFFRSVRIIIFKKRQYPKLTDFLMILLTESLPAIGNSLLIFHVLPNLDVVKGAMLANAMCIFPGLELIIVSIGSKKKINIYGQIGDIVALIAQVSAAVAWPLVQNQDSVLWLIPVCTALISFGWWENFISEKSPIQFIRSLARSRKEFPNSKYFCYSIISVINCLLFFTTTIISFYAREGDVAFLFNNFGEAFKNHRMNVTEVVPAISGSTINFDDAVSTGKLYFIESDIVFQLSLWFVCIACAYICYAFGKFACKIMIQGASFAFPIALVVPVLISALVIICGYFQKDACTYYGTIPSYLFFNSPPLIYLKDFVGHQHSASFAFPIALVVPVLISALVVICGYFQKDACTYYGTIPSYLFFNSPPLIYLKDFVGHQHAWLWLLWLLSQIWITRHIWINRNTKLSSTEQLFMRPMYHSFLIEQSLAMNRRNVVDQMIKDNAVGDDPEIDEDKITRIYACATMWHETAEEMMEFLKSIFRMDEDQATHRIVKQYLQYPVEGYYEWETHIFFDDAFWRKSEDDNDPTLNIYVQDLIATMGEAASEVHKTTVRIRPPVIYPTPYGGRLVWTLPGKTKLICHLKDKAKIRAKKRWSQVMYMYYLLGHKIIDNDEFDENRVKVRSNNTYLLALDGDIDFQPDAVHLLVQYMKKNDNLGAACGRIHPVGAGAMAWYQVFEYAVGHWMQKATEHVIGCVLCSPGCFSLFRAKALMDHNVMARYTTRSSEARHYVQYDQGEDRWLCTLLLQRGYRVEYSAASDAYTHCPEGFNEFYNQRRRWMPSTMANILDLLEDREHIKKVNDDISTPYIYYQIILMIGTVIGPGTIFLMLVGAFVTVFNMSQYTALWYNLIPILIFVLTCLLCKSDTQLLMAALISAVYGLIMMMVLIGVAMQIHDDGILAPSSLFFLLMMGEYVVAALVHPKEMYCLKYGIIYLITVPSMYMLLVIYSVFNMNNVSWGTREVSVAPKPAEGEAKKVEKKKESFVVDYMYKVRDFFQSCCSDSKHLVMISNSLMTIQQKVEVIEQKVDDLERVTLDTDAEAPRKTGGRKKTTIIEGSRGSRLSIHPRHSAVRKSIIDKTGGMNFNGPMDYDDSPDDDDDSMGTSDDLQNNSWFYDGELIRGHVTFLDKKEENFWKDLLDKYLHPIEDDKVKVAKDLKDLRDKMAMSFFAINILFVVVVFLLTIKKQILHLDWPFNPKVNFTYHSGIAVHEIVVNYTYLELEPVGFVFLIFFFALMAVQFVAMMIHRFGTFSQIMANTDVDFGNTKIENMSEEELLEKDQVRIFKQLVKLKGVNGDDELEEEVNEHVSRRKTVADLVKNKDKKRAVINDLDAAFQARMTKIRDGDHSDIALPRLTIQAIQRRRTTVLHRRSQMAGPSFDPSAYSKFNENSMPPQQTQYQFTNPSFEDEPVDA